MASNKKYQKEIEVKDQLINWLNANHKNIKNSLDNIELICRYHFLSDCTSGDARKLLKTGFFPLVQAELSIAESIYLSYLNHLTPAYFLLKLSLELTLTSVFFSIKDKKEGQEWVRSIRNTPFKRESNIIFKEEDFLNADKHINLKQKIDLIYGELNNFCHIKGSQYQNHWLPDEYNSSFNEKRFLDFANKLIEVAGIIITVIALYNPLSIAHLPLEEKLGFNYPIGFVTEGQANRLRELIPIDYKEWLINYCENHESTIGVKNWLESMPDITEDEINRQSDF